MGKMLCLYLIQLQNQVQHAIIFSSFLCQIPIFLLLQSDLSCFFFIVSEQSDPDDGAAKPNPSLTREKDLVVNISDLDNIFDEDDEELGVGHNIFHSLNHVDFLKYH